MTLRIDHVIYVTADLAAATARFRSEWGVEVLDGGEHPGGTRNGGVICRDQSYVEILAVADVNKPTGAAVSGLLANGGDRLVGWAVQTDDLDAVAERLGQSPTAGSIVLSDGRAGTWRTVAGSIVMTAPHLPFFIQYDGEPVLPAGEPTADSIAWVEVAGDSETMRDWLGDEGVDVRVVSGPVGLRAVGVDLGGSEIVIH